MISKFKPLPVREVFKSQADEPQVLEALSRLKVELAPTQSQVDSIWGTVKASCAAVDLNCSFNV